MSEIDNLLNELINMKSKANTLVSNNKDTWKLIQQGDLEGLGFNSKEEMQAWIENNPYSNI